MSAMASQIAGVSIVYSNVCSGADQRKHQSSASLAFLGGIHRWPMNFPHEGSVMQKMFPFDDIIMKSIGEQLHPTALRGCNYARNTGVINTVHVHADIQAFVSVDYQQA